MKYQITGDDLPVLEIELNSGEQVVCEGGAMTYRSSAIEMQTSFGGFGGAMSRAFSGEGMAFNLYTANQDAQILGFASKMPGEILAVNFENGRELIVQKSAFLASTPNIERKLHFQKKIGTGLFGGEGFIMQKISGEGTAFLEIDGSLIKKELAEGEEIVISTGHLAAYDATATMTIESVKGVKNKFLGGEGLFNTKVVGPGVVYLQSMPITRLAATISQQIAR
ncbi:MAG: TIGR00266 family protein [bacterium]|nr:TIGR00266 family protein [bacterium]